MSPVQFWQPKKTQSLFLTALLASSLITSGMQHNSLPQSPYIVVDKDFIISNKLSIAALITILAAIYTFYQYKNKKVDPSPKKEEQKELTKTIEPQPEQAEPNTPKLAELAKPEANKSPIENQKDLNPQIAISMQRTTPVLYDKDTVWVITNDGSLMLFNINSLPNTKFKEYLKRFSPLNNSEKSPLSITWTSTEVVLFTSFTKNPHLFLKNCCKKNEKIVSQLLSCFQKLEKDSYYNNLTKTIMENYYRMLVSMPSEVSNNILSFLTDDPAEPLSVLMGQYLKRTTQNIHNNKYYYETSDDGQFRLKRRYDNLSGKKAELEQKRDNGFNYIQTFRDEDNIIFFPKNNFILYYDIDRQGGHWFLYNINTQQCINLAEKFEDRRISNFFVSPCENYCIGISQQSGSLYFFDIKDVNFDSNNIKIKELSHPQANYVSFSPDGAFFFTYYCHKVQPITSNLEQWRYKDIHNEDYKPITLCSDEQYTFPIHCLKDKLIVSTEIRNEIFCRNTDGFHKSQTQNLWDFKYISNTGDFSDKSKRSNVMVFEYDNIENRTFSYEVFDLDTDTVLYTGTLLEFPDYDLISKNKEYLAFSNSESSIIKNKK